MQSECTRHAPEPILAAVGLSPELRAFIGGASVDASGPRESVLDPATGEIIATFNGAEASLIDEAVASARAASETWISLSGAQRGAALRRVSDLIRANAGALANAEALDSGKPLRQASADVEAAAKYFEFYSGSADKLYGETIAQDSGFAYTLREPFGVVGVITPWNSPISQMARSVAPALTAGNAVVVKPSELTPLTSLVMASLVEQAGLPSGVLNVVPGTGIEAGSALTQHPDVGFISFTGSVDTGRAVARAAGDRIVGVSLELGGKSATLVLADADLRAAARAGVGAVVRNAGQSCFATTRLVVHRSVHEELIERMVAEFDTLTVGPGLDDPDLGPLVSAAQRDRSAAFVSRALAQGASIANDVSGDVPDEGFFLRPHLMVNVTNDMELAQQEVFGPVQSVIVVDDEDEAVAVANDSQYGLAAGIFTSSITKAHRYASQLQAGQIQINRYPGGGIDTPFGGYKKSGLGREKGLEALRHYQQLKTVIVELGSTDV